jgi:hypothetical protein
MAGIDSLTGSNNTLLASLTQQQSQANTTPIQLTDAPQLSQTQLQTLQQQLQQDIQSAFQQGGSTSDIQSNLTTSIGNTLQSAGFSSTDQKAVTDRIKQSFQQAVSSQKSGGHHHGRRAVSQVASQLIQQLASVSSTISGPGADADGDQSTPVAGTSAATGSTVTTPGVGQNVNALV